ncbi:DnaJ-domain-containing protein [Testicularia cyperi]|uniref:DnaJ-domain-containing protein n=1 Tax=Testicularia cyperi TaxID=1882483 RepID=A0A317Y0Q3_9BASI|nr:DnaJ-domain-containing protein [Testicularia cyperi]
MDAPLPDYYRTLGVSPTATAAEIKESYKRRSLKTHPDRFPNASAAERQRYTQKFQTLADAYYVLSDTDRRREYDQLRRSRPSSDSFYSQPQADGIFTGVFEELLRPEVQRVAPLWKWVGGASGTALGFIVGNVPGALAGAVAGSQLGRIRDAKGKSVAEVFMGLGAGQRAEVLTRLLQRVLQQQSGPIPQ